MAANYSCNDNQNYFVSNGRTTSRVTQLPGGSSSINLGWSDQPTKDVSGVGSNNNSRVSNYLTKKRKWYEEMRLVK